MVSIAIRKPVKIAAGISPIEAVRFTGNQSGKSHAHKKNMRLNPLSMGIANFRRDRKKTISIVASLSLGGVILWFVRQSGSQDSFSRMGIIKSISILKKQNMR